MKLQAVEMFTNPLLKASRPASPEQSDGSKDSHPREVELSRHQPLHIPHIPHTGCKKSAPRGFMFV